jgi:hypothetical protein
MNAGGSGSGGGKKLTDYQKKRLHDNYNRKRRGGAEKVRSDAVAKNIICIVCLELQTPDFVTSFCSVVDHHICAKCAAALTTNTCPVCRQRSNIVIDDQVSQFVTQKRAELSASCSSTYETRALEFYSTTSETVQRTAAERRASGIRDAPPQFVARPSQRNDPAPVDLNFSMGMLSIAQDTIQEHRQHLANEPRLHRRIRYMRDHSILRRQDWEDFVLSEPGAMQLIQEIWPAAITRLQL